MKQFALSTCIFYTLTASQHREILAGISSSNALMIRVLCHSLFWMHCDLSLRDIQHCVIEKDVTLWLRPSSSPNQSLAGESASEYRDTSACMYVTVSTPIVCHFLPFLSPNFEILFWNFGECKENQALLLQIVHLLVLRWMRVVTYFIVMSVLVFFTFLFWWHNISYIWHERQKIEVWTKSKKQRNV